MRKFKHLVFFALIFPALLVAENAAVGNRPMSEEAAKEIESRKSKEVVEEDAETAEAGYVFDNYPPVYYSNSHHWLTAVVVLDNGDYTLELEDGSVWRISSYDGSKALNWRSNDPLTITQNNRWFAKTEYRIINKANGTTVEANLFLGPVIGGEYSRYVFSIDYGRRELALNDGTRWDISSLDYAIFRDWALDDYIIVGTNSNTSFWDSTSDVILINVNMNNCARAKQF